MATKTISIDEIAYQILVTARSSPRESFSSVIKRAEIKPPIGQAGAFRQELMNLATCNEDILNAWERLTDQPPDDPWQR